MNIKYCENEKYLNHMVDFQVRMARESEDFHLDSEVVEKGIKMQIHSPKTGKYISFLFLRFSVIIFYV